MCLDIWYEQEVEKVTPETQDQHERIEDSKVGLSYWRNQRLWNSAKELEKAGEKREAFIKRKRKAFFPPIEGIRDDFNILGI